MRKVLYAKKHSKDKIHPLYYKIIQRKTGFMGIKQTIRVLFSRPLYLYIKKENYLDEIEIKKPG